ncbi:MAG: HAMP domain-containing protein [Cyanobacteria bacterium J06636_16]
MLAFRNGQRTVNNLATQLRSEVTARVQQQLNTYLYTPHSVNSINVVDLSLNKLSLQNTAKLEAHFWHQAQLFPSISHVYLGTEQEIWVGAEHVDEGLPKITYWDGSQPDSPYETYLANQQGDRGELVSSVPGPDSINLPWYLAAKEAKKPTWGKIYASATPLSNIVLPAVSPVYDTAGNFQGVFAVDVSLAAVSDFLGTLEIGQTGQVFIMERSGLLVASSSTDAPFLEVDGAISRLRATQSQNPLIQGAANYLSQTFGDLNQIDQPQQFTFHLEGQRQLLQVTPYQDEFGLDWLIAVAIPESDFMAQINASTRNTVFLCGISSIIAIALGILTSRWITRPVVQLSQASQAVAAGDLEQQVETDGVGELSTLAQAFNQMTNQMRHSFATLAFTNSELGERTQALNEQTQTLQDDVEHLLDVVSVVEAGNLTVAADVSPTVTGLVADSFNRLIERIGQVMLTTAQSAEQVGQSSATVETLALDMAENARQQKESVVSMQGLMENINDLTQGNVEQVAATEEALAYAQEAIEQGQYEITAVTEDASALDKEALHITERAQELTKYTDLAAQFVREQSRIASLTRVLALNVSMLSSRSSQQQDPEQFVTLIREFEAMAKHVDDLSSKMDQSLVILEQRTEQIQTVVSGINHDVEVIGQRTDSLVMGIQQSNHAFEQIRLTTDQVASSSQQVTLSSKSIANAAHTTLLSIREISEIAFETSHRANLTKEQSQAMKKLADLLLESIAVFQLPANLPTDR